jgi:F-type H+-transporting ATPase subunit a
MTDVAETGFAIHPMDQFIVKRFFCDAEHPVV